MGNTSSRWDFAHEMGRNVTTKTYPDHGLTQHICDVKVYSLGESHYGKGNNSTIMKILWCELCTKLGLEATTNYFTVILLGI